MIRGIIFATLLFSQVALAICASLVQGQVVFDVMQCGLLNPEKTFPLGQSRYQFINDLSPQDRKNFFDSYRGLVVEGLVVKSYAIRSGLSPEKGALNGETLKVFIPPGVSACYKIKDKRLKAFMDEACCEGGGDAPCLLESTYVIKTAEVIGKSGGNAGNTKRMQAESNKDFQKANYYLSLKNFQAAAEMYEKLRKRKQLDIRGHYFLGFAYRMQGKCDLANPVLEPVFAAAERNDYWANDESVIRKASFLYARCLAMVGDADKAVLVLQSFLLAADKYREEIRLSLSHPDFGAIKTTKVYFDYSQDALKQLKH